MGFRHADSLAQLESFSMQREKLEHLNRLYTAMPPVQAIQIQATQFDGDTLHASAPLSANVNDKACAFGGSIVSVMTMAAWGFLNEKLRDQGIHADIYIADTKVRFLKPLFEDIKATAQLSAESIWSEVMHVLSEKNRARAFVHAEVQDISGQIAAQMTARFALIQTK
jgi:thioesterase domain-containing protein